MSQLFFSLSVSMGIMITYGSYVKPDVDLGKSVSMIELMDTGVALLAGMVIIPAVYVFFGVDGMSAGTGLMFISLPRVFFRMGAAGRIVGLLFFILAAFAALTSCISVLESITANCMEIFHTERKKTTGDAVLHPDRLGYEARMGRGGDGARRQEVWAEETLCGYDPVSDARHYAGAVPAIHRHSEQFPNVTMIKETHSKRSRSQNSSGLRLSIKW